ncbi:MAG: tyrosine-type recombinase/integrase [Saprospiraceae bacterium]|uniref:Tyrosine-type recombinase/integrase n=1 Tax=Candidatus Defluviibacterium haderslevense TaxID=2981993 RepID=A0A9D7S7T5_9BACT|nr:tyrosine-type recombinase/integrase [Candidatus Defluviibacterium haderslevense]MBL0236012.1 tyrosine-type recombinase/integrase [Candidatus Defluviibacterium haderslevense]
MKQNHFFELKSNRDPSKETSIRYRSHFNGGRFIYGTGLKIYPELWDKVNQKPIKDKCIIKEYKSNIPNLDSLLTNIEVRLHNITNVVDGYLSNCKINGESINEKDLKTRLDTNIKKSNKIIKAQPNKFKIELNDIQLDKSYIKDYLIIFIHEIKKGSRTISVGKSKGNRYTLGTIKNYVGLLEQFIKFEKKRGNRYKWSDLSISFYEDFLNYCNDNNLSKNFIGRLIKQLKVIAQAAMDDEIHKNNIFRDKRFETLSEKVMNIALSEQELNLLYDLDLTKVPNLDLIRDLFLVGCYTAQRWSDYSKIDNLNIQDDFITLIQKKTNEKVILPIKPKLKQILNKYPNGFTFIAEQTFNRKIKELAKKANIKDIIHIKENRGGINNVKIYKKYELISSHTARRTGATLMFKADIPTISIMKLTGHKTESSFMKYIKISEEENAKTLQNHHYFNS